MQLGPPILGWQLFQASATNIITTPSTTDVVMPGMTITPGPGDYLVWFSVVLGGTLAGSISYASVYANAVKIAHTERRHDVLLANTGSGIAINCLVQGLAAGQAIDVRWRTTAGSAAALQRTLNLLRGG